MKDYQSRVIAEKAELDERLAKLNAFARSETFDALPDAEKDLLARQSQAMDLYSVVLGERIALWSEDENTRMIRAGKR